MLYSQTELAELVCTRISHDLIGNIGALSASMELINDNGDNVDADTKSILVTAIETLKSRQKFFRIAFGEQSTKVNETDLQTICSDYLATIGPKSSSITFSCNNMSQELAKIICLIIMLTAEIFIKGGHIEIKVNSDNIVINASTDYKLSNSKMQVYQDIIKEIKPSDNISQYIAIIYLKQFLGDSVKFDIKYSEKNMELIIG